VNPAEPGQLSERHIELIRMRRSSVGDIACINALFVNQEFQVGDIGIPLQVWVLAV